MIITQNVTLSNAWECRIQERGKILILDLVPIGPRISVELPVCFFFFVGFCNSEDSSMGES